MTRFLSGERTRAGMLIVAASLIGGTGCITSAVISSVQQRNWQEAALAKTTADNVVMQKEAQQGDLGAMTRLGWYKVKGGRAGIAADPAAGLALLEQGVARHDAAAEHSLGLLLVQGAPAFPAQPARGLELIKRAASHACIAPRPDGGWSPLPALFLGNYYRQDRQGVPPDLAQAQLWYARNLVHCRYALSIGSSFLGAGASSEQKQVESLAWSLLSREPDKQRLLAGLSGEQVQAVEREAGRLRQLVADSEAQYPAPPAPGKP